MSLRVGIDMDGTIADLASLYHEYEEKLFGSRSDDAENDRVEEPEPLTDDEKVKAAKEAGARRDAIWRALRNTENLWTTLNPLEPGAVRLLYETMHSRGWEVFFITQRPKSAGMSVQQQTQQWLVAQGFLTPSVLTLTGSRGKAAHALDLDFLIDDLPKNCVDVISDSRCRPILILRTEDPSSEASARRMKIGVVRSFASAIDVLTMPAAAPRQSMVNSVLRLLGLVRSPAS